MVPSNVALFAIAQDGACDALVDDKVLTQNGITRMQAHMVVEILLILVQRVVQIDVFHVGRGLVRRVIAFSTCLTVGRVSLGHVDALVTF